MGRLISVALLAWTMGCASQILGGTRTVTEDIQDDPSSVQVTQTKGIELAFSWGAAHAGDGGQTTSDHIGAEFGDLFRHIATIVGNVFGASPATPVNQTFVGVSEHGASD